MKAGLIHVASMLFNEPLAIIPEKLEAILRAIGPRLAVDEAALEELLRADVLRTHSQTYNFDPRNVQWQNQFTTVAGSGITVTGSSNNPYYHNVVGVPTVNGVTMLQMPGQNGDDDNAKPYRLTPEGVAVIPIRGTLMKRFNFLSAASGCSTYASLGQAATTALGDSQVKAVLFDIDSPGGTTHGCFELSDMLYGMRGDKPMWGVANDLAASAAYALGSSLDRLWVTRTGGVGSVGVFARHADQSAQDEQAGVKYTYVFAGKKKTDGNPHEPLSKSARADIQTEVDRENSIFVATVARNRGFAGADAEKIAGTEAGVYFAQSATPLLADEVGTLEEALEALTAKVNGSKRSASGKVVFAAESGHNAVDTKGAEAPAPALSPATSEKPQEEEKLMAKADEDMKRAKKSEAEAAAPGDDEKDDEDDKKKPSEDEDAKKGKKAAKDDECDGKAARRSSVTEMPVAADAKQIADMCIIGGVPELAAEYISKGYSIEKVIEKLSARRAKASAEGMVNSFVAGETAGGGNRASVDSAIEQARIMSANSGGRLSQSKCMENLLRSNPAIYEGYMEERGRVAAQVAFTGGGRALTEYVLNNQRRYMANLGLGTTIDDVPGRRPM